MTLGVVVVGTGFGARVHVPALRAAGFEVCALVGRDPEKTARRAERAGVEQACTTLDEALQIPDVRAVSIVTPPDSHAPLVLQAARAGRHVLCEKPFARSGQEAIGMAEAVEQAGVVGLVGHEFRFAPERARAAQLLASGAIGVPRLATFVQYVPLVADPRTVVPPWWWSMDRGGGWLGASGSHLVDQVLTWLGNVKDVEAALGSVADRPTEAEDAFSILLRMQSGATAVLQQTAGSWGPPAGLSRVAGTDGTLWIDGTDLWLATAAGAAVVPIPAELELPAPPTPSDDPRHRFTHLELGPSIRQAECFRDLILGRPLSPTGPQPATFRDGVACMQVLDRVRTASAN